jgi:hypothetical protein
MELHEYQELKVRISPNPAGNFTTYAEGPSGQGPGVFELPLPEKELMDKVYELGRRVRSAPVDSLAEDFGSLLFDALFRDQLRDIYHESFAKAQAQGTGLRVTLGLTEVPELMQLPWEFLCHDSEFLAISDWTPVVRYLDLPTTRDPLAIEPPLRILAMVSSPSDAVPLDVERERENLEAALGDLVRDGAVEISWLEKATLHELQRLLRRNQYHVFHFIGHGAFDTATQDGMLLLEDDRARGRFVRGRNLGYTLANHKSLRLAVLNSCEGGRAADDDPFAGVASSLVRAQIPAVLAMQFEITDRAAAIFAGGFYESLADGYPVDAALSQARLAIYNDPNPLEWGTPILLMRVADGRIFDVTKPPVPPARKPPSDDQPPGVPPPPPELPPEPEPLPEPSFGERLARLFSRWRWPVLAIAALLLLVAGAAGVYFFSRGGGTSGDWSQVSAAAFQAEGKQEVHGISALSGSKAIAAGRNGSSPAEWTYNGSNWVRRDVTSESGVIHAVAARAGSIVAAGWSPDDQQRKDAAMWIRSRTGVWSAAPCTGCAGTGDERAWAVLFRNDGTLVAVGRRTGSSDAKYDAAVWLSRDGTDWRAVEDDALGGNDSQAMNGIAEISGTLVAVGRDGPDAAVWTSDDGRKWTRRRDPDLVGGVDFMEMYAIRKVGTRLVAVGWRATLGDEGQTDAAATWISFDGGRSWSPGTSASFTRRGQRMLGVVEAGRAPSVIIAVGYDHIGEESVAAAWRSTDGQSWTAIRSDSFVTGGRAEMNGVAVLSDGTVVGVGDVGPEEEADAAVWEAKATG